MIERMAKWQLHSRFSLTSMLVAIAALPVGIGLIWAVEDLAWISAYAYLDYTSGWGPLATLRALDALPSGNLYRAISEIEFGLPMFFVLAGTGFTMGLIRSRKTHVAYWFLPASLILAAVFAIFSPNYSYYVMWRFHLPIHLIGAMGVSVGWFAGWLIRGRQYDRAMQITNCWQRSVVVCAAFLALALSSYGWSMHGMLVPDLLLVGSGLLFGIALPSIPLCIFAFDVYKWRMARRQP
jgi:hypothetical protein